MKVTLPPVFDMVTRPVVVKPAIFCDVIFAFMTIGVLPAVRIPPLFTKLPPSVN